MENKNAGLVVSVNISEAKGTVKRPVDLIRLNARGVEGDAHAGSWHRMVSLLGVESYEKFSAEAGRSFSFGDFAENITTGGLLLYQMAPLDRLIFDEAELEVTQIGKKCHGKGCAIFNEVGNCVMPKEGIFARVIREGLVRPGESFRYAPKVFRAMVITLSDRASRGEYDDLSGKEIVELLSGFLTSAGWKSDICREVIPDDADRLAQLLDEAKNQHIDLVFTTGGTGIGPRDISPDVARKFIDKEIPGIMEHIRWKYGQEKPQALSSRSICGTMDQTLVFVLPGSVRAVKEYMGEILRSLKHLIFMLKGIDIH
ncbi:MAG: molybdenum cofactor synthesis protein [Bacteroidetes bacterium]|nr:molybdenum cofactor synthesis protein [Bacteroidota bacterium]